MAFLSNPSIYLLQRPIFGPGPSLRVLSSSTQYTYTDNHAQVCMVRWRRRRIAENSHAFKVGLVMNAKTTEIGSGDEESTATTSPPPRKVPLAASPPVPARKTGEFKGKVSSAPNQKTGMHSSAQKSEGHVHVKANGTAPVSRATKGNGTSAAHRNSDKRKQTTDSKTMNNMPTMSKDSEVQRSVPNANASSDSLSGERSNLPLHSADIKSEVRKLFQEAKFLEKKREYSAAADILKACLKLDTNDAHSWLALARLEARSDRSAARNTFQVALEHCPTNVRILQAFGVFEGNAGRLADARKFFRRALEYEPGNQYVYQAWGLLEHRSGNRKEARSIFMKAVGLQAQSQVCLAWAILEARDGNVVRARELFELGLSAVTRTSAHPDSLNKGNFGEVVDIQMTYKMKEEICAIYRSWAEMEERIGNVKEAQALLKKALVVLPDHAETVMALARLQARRGSFQAALSTVRAALTVSENIPSNVFNSWATLELRAGNSYQAKEILKQGNSFYPRDPSILQTWGVVEEAEGNVNVARDLFARSVSILPTAPALVAWALLEDSQKKIDRARELFEQALAVDPRHGQAFNAYAMMELRMKDMAKAKSIYQRAMSVDNATVPALLGYAKLHLIRKEYEEARELFRKGVLLTREDTSYVWHAWGMLEFQLKNAKNARTVALSALKRYPNNSRILVAAALAFAISSPGCLMNPDTAREYFKKAVLLDPNHAHAWQAWGVFEAKQADFEAATALFKRGLRLSPNHGALWQAWAVLESRNGIYTKARTLFERGVTSCPDHVHLYQAWACMEVRGGDIPHARELLEQALKTDREHGPVWTAYGLLEARFGTLDRARFCFSEGARVAPYHAPLFRTWAQTEAKAGNYARARELFAQGLEADPLCAPLYHASAEMEAMLGNFGALADLQRRAESYFGTNLEIPQGCEIDAHFFDLFLENEDYDQSRYIAMETEMEKAIREAQKKLESST